MDKCFIIARVSIVGPVATVVSVQHYGHSVDNLCLDWGDYRYWPLAEAEGETYSHARLKAEDKLSSQHSWAMTWYEGKSKIPGHSGR